MDTWIFQGGHPVVAVEATSEAFRSSNRGSVTRVSILRRVYPNHYSSSGGFRTGRETGSVGGQP